LPLSTVVGHSKQLSVIKTLVSSRMFPQSSLFVGPEGVGKKLIALETLTLIADTPLNVKIIGSEKPATIDEIREIGKHADYIKWLNLTGGEPFLRKDVIDIVKSFPSVNLVEALT